MKLKLATIVLMVAALTVATLSNTATTRLAQAATTIPVKGCPDDPSQHPPCPGDDVVLRWDEQLLASIRANPGGTGPTVTARALGVVHTAMYDAWEAYDRTAKSTRPNGNPELAPNDASKSKAISFAAYKALVDLFPSREGSFAGQMNALGYTNFATDMSTEAKVGNAAAAAVLAYRHADGSNQTNNANGTVTYPCSATATPCYYQPTRQWFEQTEPFRWQPLCVPLTAVCKPVDPNGPNPQAPLTPQWANVIPFASSPAQYKVMGPPRNPDGTYSTKEVVTAVSDGNLGNDDVKKTKAEYWADGPETEFPPGHSAVFAQALSRKNRFSLDQDVKLFFALGNALMDASIGAWWTKYKDKWGFWRPITAIRYVYKGQDVPSWLGPGKGYGTVKGENWIPYQDPIRVVTPPFPEYVSGHSTFTAAGSIVLMTFAGTDSFGGTVTIPANSSKIDPGVPAQPVTLTWPTFTAAADEAGMSRRYGGIHFYSGDMHGRALGNLLGRGAYSKAQAYWQGMIGS